MGRYNFKYKIFFSVALATFLFSLTSNAFAAIARGGTITAIPLSRHLVCTPHPTDACYNVDVVSSYGAAAGIPGNGAVGTHKCWAIYNFSAFDVAVPMNTQAEFQSFITAASGGDPYLTGLGVTAQPCCDPSRCALPAYSLDCTTCINEGSMGAGLCCGWTCATPGGGSGLNVNGNPCCQIDDNPLITPRNPPFTLDPGLLRDPLTACVDSCGNGTCEAWENNSNCCVDCNVAGDGYCCAADGENIGNTCQDCGTNCGDGFCCAATSPTNPLSENRTNCADCAVCPDGYCSPGETQINCCQDCNAVCGNLICCSNPPNTGGTETQANCCNDCGCWGGFSCVGGACHDNCDTLPYIHDSGSYQCTISSVSIHNQTMAGGCAITGTCSALCADGNMINWINNCCTNWAAGAVPATCGTGGCSAIQRLDTRTCSSIATAPLTNCVNDVGCCTTWGNSGCQAGGCGRGQMYQTRNCGGSTQTRCVDDPVNCCSCDGWSTQGCGNDGCGGNDQRWRRACYPDNCASEDQGCVYYCGCAGNCCDNDGNCEYAEDNPSCCDCFNCGNCGCQSSKGENCSTCGSDCGCPGGQVCDSGSCRLPSCGELGGNCCGGGGCRASSVGNTFDCGTSCCDGSGCYPDPWSGNWGPFVVIRHGNWASNWAGLANAPGGFSNWNNYQIIWYTEGHRHGGSHVACSGSYGGVGISGSGDGGALGPEYGGYHGTQWPFGFCSGSGVGTFNAGGVTITVQDAEAFFYWTINAY